MRKEVADLIGSALSFAGLVAGTIATLAPISGAGVAAQDPAISPTAEYGRMLFYAKGCLGCHSRGSDGSLRIGPNLAGLAERAGTRVAGLSAADYVRQSLREPQAYVVESFSGGVKMPDLDLSDGEVEALVAYLLGPE